MGKKTTFPVLILVLMEDTLGDLIPNKEGLRYKS